MRKCLLIGFGNTLRRDDGLGPYVVDRLSTEALNGMEISKISIPQIDVILATDLSKVDVAFFVDARVDDCLELVTVSYYASNHAKPLSGCDSHCLSISDLLSLTRDLYGSAPESYTIMPKGFDFSLGETLSPGAERAADLASKTLVELIKQLA